MGVVDGNQQVSDNDWETITRSGDAAIRNWIDGQLNGTTVAVVLIGSNTAGRKWINYEIDQAWKSGKGIIGIFIHNLKDNNGKQTARGKSPFEGRSVNGISLSSVIKLYDPPGNRSEDAYAHIANNISKWIEDAISTRSNYGK